MSKEKEMSFLDHLEVLRWHLVRSVAAIILFAVLAFIYKDFVFDKILLAPKNPDFPTYVFFYFSIIFSSPRLKHHFQQIYS